MTAELSAPDSAVSEPAGHGYARPQPVGPPSVGAASVGPPSVDAASVDAASVGAASVGEAAVDPASFDSLSVAQLRARGTVKWNLYAPDVLALWVAEMDFPLAPVVREAVTAALDAGAVGYGPDSRELAQAFADYSREHLGARVDPGRCSLIRDVLTGVENGIDAYSPAGSPVVVPTPAYMPFLDVPGLHGRPLVELPLIRDAAGVFRLDLDRLDAAFAAGARTLILCQPYNPVGRVFSASELRALAELVDRHGAFVISDEVHAPIRFGVPHVSYAESSELAASHCLTVTAASKGWSFPGLPCALAITHTAQTRRRWHEALVEMRIHGATPLGIAASIAAYRHGQPWLDAALGHVAGNAAWLAGFLDAELPEVGYIPGEGTYFAWLDLAPLGLPGAPGQWLREHARVALNLGRTFGRGNDSWVRMNLACPRPILVGACERISRALAAR